MPVSPASPLTFSNSTPGFLITTSLFPDHVIDEEAFLRDRKNKLLFWVRLMPDALPPGSD